MVALGYMAPRVRSRSRLDWAGTILLGAWMIERGTTGGNARPAYLTFDCYGTLIDWESGISGAVLDAASDSGVELDRATVLTWHAELEPMIQANGFRSYKEVLTEVALGIADRAQWSITREIAGFLPASVPAWMPFPDTNPALERLRSRGHRLGILSNVDDDLLSGTLEQLAVEFDLLITAEQVRSYKPAPAHFDRAREEIGDAPWLHVAQSYFHDIGPAHDMGIDTVWINRKRESPAGEARPVAEFENLQEFVAALDAGRVEVR